MAEATRDGDMQTSLPLLKDQSLLQTRWKSILDPIVANPILQGFMIEGIVLNSGVEKTVQIGLGRTQQGWFIVDQLSNANVWRTQSFNANNLFLQSSADTTISIWVF